MEMDVVENRVKRNSNAVNCVLQKNKKQIESIAAPNKQVLTAVCVCQCECPGDILNYTEIHVNSG